MRRYFSATVLAAAFMAAAPVQAQRASLADRVSALEQQASSNRGNVDLLNQITALKSDVQTLRAQIEDLQHQAEQSRQSDRSQYLDLDGRLNRLEGNLGQTPAVAATTKPAVATPQESAPAVYGDAGTLAKGADERSSYETAFGTLRAGRYDESAVQFQDFLQRYPDGAYAPNALYWLGESYYATQNYALAQQQFQTLLDRYPTHDKAAGALLKVGLSQYGLKQIDAAQATLSQVVQRFPGSEPARTADDRLRAIQLQRVR